MNAPPADIRSPHLDLADLIAASTGQPVGDRAREHLASCEPCRTEANRWDLVAQGVRGLAADLPQTAQPAPPPRQALPHRRTGLRVPAGRRPRTLLAAGAAAALILLGFAGYWAGDTLTGQASATVLTAVSGCTGIQQAAGTIERVTGDGVVIMTASGQPVTVHATASARVSMTGALLGDISDGAQVMVLGPSSGATIAAAGITLGPLPTGAGAPQVTPPPGWAVVRGTVADVSTAGFTVVTSSGTRVPVSTSSGTNVVVPRARLAQLRAGETVVAFGHAGPGNTLSAIALSAAVPLPPHPGPQVRATLHIRGCSPGALAMALAAGI